MMEVALTIFVLASLLMSGVGTFLAAGLGFLLYGIAKALYDPAVYAYLGDVVPYHRRGRAIGIVELSWSAAWLLGVPASGSTMELFGWRAPWTVLIGLGLLSGGLIHVVLPPISRSSDGDKLSPLSTIATWTTLLRRRSVIVLLLVNLLLTLANEIPFIVYGAWLEASFGLSLTAVGLASVVVGLAEAIAEFGTVAFTDRLGKKRSVLVGLLGLATSLVALPWLSRLGLAAALVGIVLMMLSFEFSWVSLVPLATELAPDSRATLLSLNSTSSNIARILGAFVGGWLWYGGSIALHAGVGIACVFAASLLLVWGMTEGPDP